MKVFVKSYYPYFPIAGLFLYVAIFSVASTYYPGGSFNRPEASGYSFFNNFLCDVMDPITKGGAYNPARSLAIISHLVLSATMMLFFYLLPEIFTARGRNFYLIRYVGALTMFVFSFMYTRHHDLIVTATGVLGTLALIPFFVELSQYPDKFLKLLAYMCFLLSLVVFFIFETKLGYYYLPFLQKITFAVDGVWVI
ncbi:MAG: hypothetical protein ACKOE6_05965 [Flammeovirgaceae bacterium]